MSGTGLSANPKEYRARLDDQPDDQIDRWVSELMRDVVKRRGIVKVVADFRSAAQAQRGGIRTGVRFRRRCAADARTRSRRAASIVPTISLWALVPGVRGLVADSRGRLIEYLVANFEELVYV